MAFIGPDTDEEVTPSQGFTGPETDTEQQPSELESGLRGAAQGASMGFADEIEGAVRSLMSDKTYTEARDEARQKYHEAEQTNPKSYMAGEFGGAAATAAIPGLGELTIPKMAAQGAMYGLGSSEADLTKGEVGKAAEDTAIGGAIGTAAGGLGKLASKVIPGLAKTAVSTFGPSGEAIEARLAGKAAQGLEAGPTAEADVIEGISKDLWNRIGQDSAKAQSVLNPESYTTLRELGPVFADLQDGLRTQGSLVGDEQKAASDVLNNWFTDLHQIAKQNNGVIPEPALGDFVRLIDKSVPNWNAPHADIIDSVQKQLRGALDSALKQSNPEYAKAMEPVSKQIDLVNNVKKAFNLSPKYEATDATNSKLGTVLNENKTHAQELLGQLEDMYGHPFQENLKNFQLSKEFEKGAPVKGLGLLGRTSRLVGVDGGTVAKNIIDGYLKAKGSVENTAASQALQKYGPLLVDAAKRGGNALASTHFVLATSDPAYQKLVEAHQ